MGKYPEHNKDFFYKFASIDTALTILKSGLFRYSSPVSFNDPFDIQTDLYFSFNIKDLPNIVANEVDAIVRGRRIVSLDLDGEWCKAIAILKEEHKKGNYRTEHLDLLLKPLVQYLSGVLEDSRKENNKYWEELLNKIKVFCISEHNDSILMWSHYAKFHTGVCFKLKVLREKDNPICGAKQVEYLPNPPSFFSAKEWVDSILLNKKRSYSDLFYRYPISKSNIWSYEKEWRVWAPFDNDGKSYKDIPIVDGEIDSLYFGVNSDPKMVKVLSNIAREYNVKHLFRSEKKIEEYGLVYHEI